MDLETAAQAMLLLGRPRTHPQNLSEWFLPDPLRPARGQDEPPSTAQPSELTEGDIRAIREAHMGEAALRLIRTQRDALRRKLMLSNADIVKIVTGRGGELALRTMLSVVHQRPFLIAAGFLHHEIVDVTASKGGNLRLMAVIRCHEKLMQEHVTKHKILDIVYKSGWTALRDAYDHFDALRGLQFERDDIMRVAEHGGGEAVKAMSECGQQLIDAGFLKKQVVCMAARKGGSSAVKAVRDGLELIKVRGLDKGRIVEIASQRQGAARVQTFLGLGGSRRVARTAA